MSPKWTQPGILLEIFPQQELDSLVQFTWRLGYRSQSPTRQRPFLEHAILIHPIPQPFHNPIYLQLCINFTQQPHTIAPHQPHLTRIGFPRIQPRPPSDTTPRRALRPLKHRTRCAHAVE
jgi:hypothetical protein